MDESEERRTVHHLMKNPVHTVSPSDSVVKAIRLMLEKNIGSVVVVDGMRPVGIFTERDLVRVAAKDVNLLDRPISESMSTPLITIDQAESPTRALARMAENKITHLPVIHGDKLVGMATQRDLVGWFMKNPAVLLGL